jgi:dipeptidyl aminopeptidase/acylaminoacyl peptidase
MITIPGGTGSTIPPSMSVDGRYVAYQYLSGSQARVWDSVSSAIIYMGASSVVSMALSPTGNKLLYQTPAGIYLADVINNSNVLFFPTKKAIQSAAQWSADGHFFAFITESNLVSSGPTDGNGTNDVYLCDASSGDAILVSLNAAGTASANGPSDSPVVSGDGRFVVYRSFATDIVSGITNTPNIFIFDRVTGSNSLLAAAGTATAGRSWNSNPAISANGKTVSFQSWDALAPIDLNFAQDAFASAVSPWGIADSDADGIPDLWMSHYFGHPTGQDFDESKANDDADGDGMTTLQEYLAGSDPVDYFSALRVVVAISTTNNATLTWPAAPGKNYEVQYKDDLNDPAWLHADGDVLIIGGQGRFTIPAIEPNRFYRILSED